MKETKKEKFLMHPTVTAVNLGEQHKAWHFHSFF